MTLWTAARQAPLSMGFSRQEFWSGLPLPSPGDLSKPGIKPVSPGSPTLQVDSLPAEPQGRPYQIKYLFKTHGTVKSGESESESLSQVPFVKAKRKLSA